MCGCIISLGISRDHDSPWVCGLPGAYDSFPYMIPWVCGLLGVYDSFPHMIPMLLSHACTCPDLHVHDLSYFTNLLPNHVYQ